MCGFQRAFIPPWSKFVVDVAILNQYTWILAKIAGLTLVHSPRLPWWQPKILFSFEIFEIFSFECDPLLGPAPGSDDLVNNNLRFTVCCYFWFVTYLNLNFLLFWWLSRRMLYSLHCAYDKSRNESFDICESSRWTERVEKIQLHLCMWKLT